MDRICFFFYKPLSQAPIKSAAMRCIMNQAVRFLNAPRTQIRQSSIRGGAGLLFWGLSIHFVLDRPESSGDFEFSGENRIES